MAACLTHPSGRPDQPPGRRNHPGALWRLDGKDLQVNLVRLDRGDRIPGGGPSSAGALWALEEPLPPAPSRPPYGGRHRTISDRACLAAIVFMGPLPPRGGCYRPVSLAPPHRMGHAGMFDALHLAILNQLGEQGRLDWERAGVDSASVRASRGGPCGRKSRRSWQAREQAPPGLRGWPAAADRRGDRSQHRRHHRVPGRAGRCPPVQTPSGRRRSRPGKVHADKG
jgi:hypothetical protein